MTPLATMLLISLNLRLTVSFSTIFLDETNRDETNRDETNRDETNINEENEIKEEVKEEQQSEEQEEGCLLVLFLIEK